MNSSCSMASTPRWPANTSVYSLKSEQPEISASGATWKRESDPSTRGGRRDIAVNGFANQEHHSDMQDFNCNNSGSTHEDSNGCEMEKESVAVDSHNLACVHDNIFFRKLGLKHQHKHESGHERGEKRFSRQLSDSEREPKSFNDEDVVEYKPGSGFVHKLLDKFSSLSAREESSSSALKEKRSLSLENLADDDKPLQKVEKRGASAHHGDQLNHRAISVENLNHKPLSLRSVSYTPSDHSSHKKQRSPRDVFPDVNFARENIIIIEQPAVPQRESARRDSSSERHNSIEIVSLRDDVDKEDELPKPNTVNTVRSIFEKSLLGGGTKRRNLSTSSISSDVSPRFPGSVAAKSSPSSVIQRESVSVSTPREPSPVKDTADVALRSHHGSEVPKPEQRSSAEIPPSSPKKPEPVRRASSSDILLDSSKPPVPTASKPQAGRKVVSGSSSAVSQKKDQKEEADSTHLIFSSESLPSGKPTRKEKRVAPPVPSVPPAAVPRNSHKEKEVAPEPLTPRDRGSGGRLPGLRGTVSSSETPAPKPKSEAPVIPPRNDVKTEVFSSSNITPPAPSSPPPAAEVAKEPAPVVNEIFSSQAIPTPAEPVTTPREKTSPPKEVSTPRDPPQNHSAPKEAVSIPKKPAREEKENRFVRPQKPPTPRISHEKVDKPVKADAVTNSTSSSSSPPPPVNNHSSSDDAPIKGVPTIVALRMQKSKDPSAVADVTSNSEAFGVALKPSKRLAPSPPGSASSSTPASSQNSSETDDTDGGNLFRKKLKPRDMNTGVALVFDSSQVDRKPETVVPRLDLSSLDEPDRPQHGYQEGYKPTKIKPCKIHFEGANVLLEKSNLRKKPRVKKGVITFADNLTKLFEYPSEQSELEEYLVRHPEEEAELVFLAADIGESTDDAEDEEPETPRGGKGGGGLLEAEADSTLKSNTALSHSAGFSSYQPKNVMEYEFGAVLKEPEPPKVAPQQPPPPDPNSVDLLPADEVDSWSEATTSDLLF